MILDEGVEKSSWWRPVGDGMLGGSSRCGGVHALRARRALIDWFEEVYRQIKLLVMYSK